MMLARQSARWGRILFRYRRLFPLFLFLSALCALLLARPFSIVRDTPVYASVCLLLILLGWRLRLLAVGYLPRKRKAVPAEAGSSVPPAAMDDGADPELPVPGPDVFVTAGIYSRMRHPYEAGCLLMWLGFILFVGVGWYIVGGVLICLFWMEKVLTEKERRLRHKFGKAYSVWCGRTGIISSPRGRRAKSGTGFAFGRALSREYKSLSYTVFSCVAVHAVKVRVVDFSWELSPFWLAVGGVALLFLLFPRFSRS